MNKIFLTLTIACVAFFTSNAQNIISTTFLGERSIVELEAALDSEVENAVELYKVLYEMTGIDGNPDTASGLLVIPVLEESTTLPIVIYQHGTTSGKSDAPSNLAAGSMDAMAFGANGFITSAADYLGLGNSRGFHPYVHAQTEADAGFEMLNATVEFLEGYEGLDWDLLNIFISGYSQGGHASMAAHQYMEEFWSIFYPVTATSHMSGPYSISKVMKEFTLSDEPYGFPSYLAYVILGYQEVYGDLYEDIREVFKEPYASQIEVFGLGNTNLINLNLQLTFGLLSNEFAVIPSRMLQDSVRDAIQNDPDYIMNNHLRENDTHNWAPIAPTRLLYCTEDAQVDFQNAIFADSAMNANGAVDLQSMNMGPFGHGACAPFAFEESIRFFKSFLETTSTKDHGVKDLGITVSPNPASDYIRISGENSANEIYRVTLISLAGGEVIRGEYNLHQDMDIAGIPPGLYFLAIEDGRGKQVEKIIIEGSR